MTIGMAKGITTVAVKKGILLLLLSDRIPNFEFSKWIKQFGIEYDSKKHSDIKYIFNEYNNLVSKLEIDLNERIPLKNGTGHYLTPLEIYNQVNGYKLRIRKLKLMIDRDLLITDNLHKPTGIKYAVVRSNWLDNEGKLYRKFSKNLGSEAKLKINGVIPPYKIKESLEDITMMMWDQYKLEYKDE